MIKIALAVCHCLESQVSSDNFDMLVILFKNIRNNVASEDLYKAVEDTRYTKKEYDTTKKEVEKI